MSRVSTER